MAGFGGDRGLVQAQCRGTFSAAIVSWVADQLWQGPSGIRTRRLKRVDAEVPTHRGGDDDVPPVAFRRSAKTVKTFVFVFG